MLDQSGLRKAIAAAALVTQVAVVTAGATALGHYGDGELGSSPLLMVVGAFGGFLAGIYRLFQAIQRLDDDSEDHPP